MGPAKCISFLLMFLCVSYAAPISLEQMEVAITPNCDLGSHRAEWVPCTLGHALPIEQEGVYHFRSIVRYDSLESPALYISPPNFPLEIYLNGDMIYKWSELNSRRMASYRANLVSLAPSPARDTLEIRFYTDGQQHSLPTMWIAQHREVASYVTRQNIIGSTLPRAFVILSFLMVFMTVGYYFISGGRHKDLLYIAAFCLFEGVGYFIMLFDGPQFPELPLFRFSRASFPFAAYFMLLFTIRYMETILPKWLHRMVLSLCLLNALLCFLVPTKADINTLFAFVSSFFIGPIFVGIGGFIVRMSLSLRSFKSAPILISVVSYMVLSIIDISQVNSPDLPYAWFSSYSPAVIILMLIWAVGKRESQLYTDLLEFQEQLVDAHVLIQEEARAKEQFIKTLSHEVKTPLNGIVGITTELIDPSTPYHTELARSVKKLHIVISNIFFYEYLQQGKSLALLPVTFNPIETVEDLLSFHNEVICSKGLSISLVTDRPDRKLQLKGDSEKFAVIINNLISNAVKFTDAGTIRVNLSFGDGTLSVTVQDSGCGIHAEKLQKLFSFHDEEHDHGYTRKYEGIGIGLEITSWLANLMGGSIEADSLVGVGSTFIFVAPFEEVEVSSDPKVNELKVGDESKKMILIVEDNITNREILSEMAKEHGYTTNCVGNGKEALTELRSNAHAYKLVFMDVQMPVMDGIEATREIRRFSQIPIVAVTANADAEECLAVGMNDYLHKPFSMQGIFAMLDKWATDRGKSY